MDEIETALEGMALTAVVAVSTCPASEALNVPGEPRVVGDVILNCLRFQMGEDYSDVVPELDDAIVAIEEALEWDDVTIDTECHFVNVHDVNGRWRIDFSFHFVLGIDPKADDNLPFTIGIAGLFVMDTTDVPEECEGEVLARIGQISGMLLAAHHASDEGMDHPCWNNIQSTLYH